jgi:Mg/Co/Ni transporter MgtE
MAVFISFLLPQIQQKTGADFDFFSLALAVSLALMVQVLSATVMGALLPIAARAIRLDPAVVSAPSLASTVDISGMLIYFAVVGAILHLH